MVFYVGDCAVRSGVNDALTFDIVDAEADDHSKAEYPGNPCPYRFLGLGIAFVIPADPAQMTWEVTTTAAPTLASSAKTEAMFVKFTNVTIFPGGLQHKGKRRIWHFVSL